MFRSLSLFALFAGTFLLSSTRTMAVDLHWSVYDKKTDKKLLDLDNRLVENASGKRILVWDGKRIENTDGKALLIFDGDSSTGFSIRNPKDTHVRLLWSNGHQLCKQVQEQVVFDYDGRNRNIAINGEDRSTYTLTCHNGNLDSRLESWQVVAIAYALQPKLFVVSDEEAAAQRAEAEKWAKETETYLSNRLYGDFISLSTTSKVFQNSKLTVKPVGKLVYMNYDLESGKKLQGIGLHMNRGDGNDQEQILTAFNEDGVVALGIYEIEKGQLKGTWYPASLLANPKTALGIENLTGKTGQDLTGQFTITEAKTPDKNETYSGTLDIAQFRRTDSSNAPAYYLTWNLGGVKMAGVGVQVSLFDTKTSTRKNYLVAAVGNGELVVGQHFSTTSSDVHLDYAVLGKTITGDSNNAGYIMLTTK